MLCEARPPGTLRTQRTDHQLTEFSTYKQSWANIYTEDVTSNECHLKVSALFNCQSNVDAVRSFRGNEAQTFIDFLDRVSKLCVPSSNNSTRQTQVLARSCLDEKLRQRCLRLISKICKAHGIIPASYLLQREFVRIGKIHCHGGFADVSEGEYFGCLVAIKRLKMNEREPDRVFRVRLFGLVAIVILQTFIYHISPSDYVVRSSTGNIYPIRTSYLC